jgi:hypothetical protein
MLVVKEDPVTFVLAFAEIITLPMEEVKLDPVTSAITTASTSPIAGVNAVPDTVTLASASVPSLPIAIVTLETRYFCYLITSHLTSPICWS